MNVLGIRSGEIGVPVRASLARSLACDNLFNVKVIVNKSIMINEVKILEKTFSIILTRFLEDVLLRKG